MIRTETVIIEGQTFIHTYSDNEMYIYGGYPEGTYTEAFDPVDSGRTYIETDTPIETEENASAEDILNILMGEN